MTHTIVIGGGVAGLATAALLAREGHRVQLLEKNRSLGGRAGSLERDGFRFDTGPSWYLMPGVFEHFYNLLGTSTAEQLDLRLLDPGYRVYVEPAGGAAADSVTMPHGLENAVRVFEEREAGSGEQLRRYLASSQHVATMAERHFLYNPFTRWRTLLAPEIMRSSPQLFTLLGSKLEPFISRRFNDPVLQQILGYPAVFLGTDPADAPALYHLMSAYELGDGVQYPMGGFWSLIESLESLARQAGVEIETEADVTEISVAGEGRRWHATGVRWRDARGVDHHTDAEIVVSGADLHHTETTLLPAAAQSYPETYWEKQQSGPGAVIVFLGVKGEVPQLEHHTLFFTRDWHDNFDAIFGSPSRVPEPASLYVCKPSATDPEAAPIGHENIFILIPVPADVEIGAGAANGQGSERVERAADLAIDQIAEWAEIPDLRERIVVRQTLGPADFVTRFHSWHGGMLGQSHILRQSAMFRPQNQSKRVQNLYYAGATTAPGVGLPMCLISAELVLKRIRGDHSAGPLPTPISAGEAAI